MPYTLNPACPLCGLRYSDRPLLELHLREDHLQRDRRAEPEPGDPLGAGARRPSAVPAEAVSGHGGDGASGGGRA